MPKKITVTVFEELPFLERMLSKTTSSLKRARLQALLFVKKNKYSYQSDIAKKLGRTEKTIRLWLQEYEKEGLSALLEVKSGGNNTRTLSERVLSSIEEKITDPKTTITSYVELKATLENEFGEKIKYGALYSHCRRKYKSKLKVARKSHHKKDPDAEAFFKKP